MKPTAWCLVCLVIAIVVVGSPVVGRAAPVTVCFEAPPVGLGSVDIHLTLQVDVQGPFFHMIGSARITQAITPLNAIIVYSLVGTAIPNADGFWLSLSGAGYNVADQVFNGLFAMQLNSGDPTKSTLTYSRQDLEGSPPTVVVRTPQITPCPTEGA
jgi:hypothetical protein